MKVMKFNIQENPRLQHCVHSIIYEIDKSETFFFYIVLGSLIFRPFLPFVTLALMSGGVEMTRDLGDPAKGKVSQQHDTYFVFSGVFLCNSNSLLCVIKLSPATEENNGLRNTSVTHCTNSPSVSDKKCRVR